MCQALMMPAGTKQERSTRLLSVTQKERKFNRREKQHNSEGSKTAQAIPGPMLSSAVLQAQLRLVIPHLHDCPSKIQHNAPIQQLALSEALGLPHNWAW